MKHVLAGADVPAHRIVNSRGELSGAIHFDMPDEQRFMLLSEGVETRWNGRIWCVDLKEYGWKNTSDDAKRFQLEFENACDR